MTARPGQHAAQTNPPDPTEPRTLATGHPPRRVADARTNLNQLHGISRENRSAPKIQAASPTDGQPGRRFFYVWQSVMDAKYSVTSLERMNMDHTLDPAPARDALGITWRPFRPEFPKQTAAGRL